MSDVNNEDRWWAALAYALTPFSALLMYVLKEPKNRPFVQAHLLQALILGLINAALAASIGWLCLGLVNLVITLYQLVLAYRAYRGEAVVIPFITDLIRNQGWA